MLLVSTDLLHGEPVRQRRAPMSVSAARAVVEAAAPAGTASSSGAPAGTVARTAVPAGNHSALQEPVPQSSGKKVVESIKCMDGHIETYADGSRCYNGERLARAHYKLRMAGVRGFDKMLAELRTFDSESVSPTEKVEVRGGAKREWWK